MNVPANSLLFGGKTHDELEQKCLRVIYDAAKDSQWRAAKALIELSRRARNAASLDGRGNRFGQASAPDRVLRAVPDGDA